MIFLLIHLYEASEVVKAIKECKDLQALRLNGNTIGVEAAAAIADALKDRKELEVLLIISSTLTEFFKLYLLIESLS